MVTKSKTFPLILPPGFVRGECVVSANIRVIPVEGVTALPDIDDLPRHEEQRRDHHELIALNVAASVAVSLVCCAWLLLTLD